jgi:sugar transferase (PEP-CTERM system associated)
MVRLFRVFIPVTVLILLISEILLAILSYVAAAYIGYEGDPHEYLFYGTGALNIALVVISIIVGLYLHDLYSDLFVKSRLTLIQQLCFILGAAFLIQGAVSYVDRSLRMPLHVMVPGSAMAIAVIYGWRILFSSYAIGRMGGDRLLLVGSSPALAEVSLYIEAHPEMGVKVIGSLSDEENGMRELAGAKLLGRLEALRDVVAATTPTRIVVGMHERRSRMPVAELLDLRYSGHLIEEAPTTYERICGRVCTKELRPSQLIYSGDFGPRRRMLLYQNFTNIVIATIGILLAAPLMLLTALAVRFTSSGPILYRQTRVGMDGIPFTLYKFRSMCVDAEAGTGAVWAQKNDPRVTPVGGFIRKIRFDELPQFFNVVRGEMSIVGPRPERPEFVKTLSEKIPYYRQRHAVRPGITGWAQINYKYGDTLEDTIAKLEYDLYYIKNMSWSLDSYIIFHTVKAMLLSRGAQ